VEDSLGPGGPRFTSNGVRSRHYHDSDSEESRLLAPFQQKSSAVEDWHHQIEENQLRQEFWHPESVHRAWPASLYEPPSIVSLRNARTVVAR
jgi:hypothetical protein